MFIFLLWCARTEQNSNSADRTLLLTVAFAFPAMVVMVVVWMVMMLRAVEKRLGDWHALAYGPRASHLLMRVMDGNDDRDRDDVHLLEVFKDVMVKRINCRSVMAGHSRCIIQEAN